MKKKLVVKLANDPDLPSPGPNTRRPADTELKDRLLLAVKSRADSQFELAARFDHATTTREQERAKARKLFTQASVASTEAPSLQIDLDPAKIPVPKTDIITPGGTKLASAGAEDVVAQVLEGSPAPRVDAFLEKNAHLFLTEAQRNFPELLKVARPVPNLSPSKGGVKVRAQLSGGSA